MFEEITTVQIPTYAITYLEYGDASGIEEEDATIIDEWLGSFTDHTSLSFEYERDDDGDIVDPSFTGYPEFGLACDTIQTTIWGHTK